MKHNHVKYEKNNGIARVTLNRPEVLNALNVNTISDLDAIVNDAAADSEVGVLLLTGEGEKAFAAPNACHTSLGFLFFIRMRHIFLPPADSGKTTSRIPGILQSYFRCLR